MSLVAGRSEFAGELGRPYRSKKDFPYLIFHFPFSILSHGHDVTGLQWQMKNLK